MMRRLQLIALALGAVSLASGAAITSAANGNWNSTSSWTGGVVPGDGDTVTITHNITVTTDTTIGNSPADVIGSTPTLPVIALQRTKTGASSQCGDSETVTTNGKLTINSGVTFTVKGSVSVNGTTYYCSPIITLQPGSTWRFDNTATPTAVYRLYGLTLRSLTQIIAPGIGWGAGQFITIQGRNPSCTEGDGTGGTCKNAVWFNEINNGTVKGGWYDTFRHNYNYVKFWYFGSPTDAYRSFYIQTGSEGYGILPQVYMTNVEWHNSTGFGDGGNYPAANMDFKLENVKSVNSIGSNGFFWIAPTSTALVGGKSRTAKYLYFDTGSLQSGLGVYFTNFQVVSYVVFDNQKKPFGPATSSNPTSMPTVDHFLVRQAGTGAMDSTFFGDTDYSLWVVDGGVGDTHCIKTNSFSSGSHNWIISHHIWQHGDAANSSDTDPTTARPVGVNGFPSYWNYLLMLPNAAMPTATAYALGIYQYTTTSNSVYNHSVISFGKDGAGTGGIIGTMYIGETDSGVAGTVGIKNSILWNPNTTAYGSPIGIHTSSSYCGPGHLNSCVANAFDPTQIHNNMVWNYDPTVSQRWTSAVTGCSGGAGGNCASYGTPYDYKMTTAPGANDLWGTPTVNPQNKPSFVWQTQGLTAPGPREWAHTRFGADITTGETSTEVHFATTFAVFGAADPSDTTTTAGLKGRIDDMFSWIYGMWASTNQALKGAADDGSDIGAAPVVSLCPGAYPAADMPRCNGLAQAVRPADLGSSSYSAGSN